MSARHFLAALALLATSACSPLAPDSPRVQVSFRETADVGRELFRADITDGRHYWTLQGADLSPESVGGRLTSREIRIDASHGYAAVTVALREPDSGDLVTGMRIFLALRPDQRWRIDAVPAALHPGCASCGGSAALPMPAEFRAVGADSLFVLWTASLEGEAIVP